MDFKTWMGHVMGKWWENLGLSWHVIPLVSGVITVGSFATAFFVAQPNSLPRAVFLGIGSLGGLIALLAIFPFAAYLVYRELYVDTEPLVILRSAQEREPSKYLRLAWEYFDFSARDGFPDYYWLKFQLDSGFVSEKRVSKLLIRTALGGSKETDADGILQREPFEWPRAFNVPVASRTQLTAEQVPIKGEQFRQAIDDARTNGRTTVRLEVEVHVEGISNPIPLKTTNIPVVVK